MINLFTLKLITGVLALAATGFIVATVVFGYMGAMYAGDGTNVAANVAILSFFFSLPFIGFAALFGSLAAEKTKKS